MSQSMMAVVVFGALVALALVMFTLERRAVAKRRAEGRNVDVSDLIFFGSEAGRGKKTVLRGEE
jgi:nitrate reductase gamma subunit